MTLRSIGELLLNHKEGDYRFLLKVEAYFTFLSHCNVDQIVVQWQAYEMWLATLNAEEKKIETVKVFGEAVKARMLALALAQGKYFAPGLGGNSPGLGGINPVAKLFAGITKDEEYFRQAF